MDPFDTRLLSQPRPHSGDPLDHKLLEGHEPGLSDPFDTRLLQGGESTRGDAPRGPRRLPHADQFYEGLKSGTAQLSGSFAGLGALVANELGMHTERDALQKRMFEKQHEAGQAELAVRDIAEIDNPSDFLDWASGTLGQVAPSVALSFGGGGVGGLIGRGLIKQGLKNGLEKEAIAALTAQGFTNKQAIRHAVRLQLANPATHQRMIQASRYGTGAGAWASSAMPVTGETLMTLRDAGLNIDEAAATAFGVGALGGALDALPTVMLLDKFFPGVDKELAKSFVRQVTETLAQQTGMEFLTEGSQEAIQIAAHAYHDPSFRFSDAGNARQILNAAAAGALAGAATGGAGGVAAASMDGVGKAARKASDQVAKWHEQAQQVERTVMGTWRETPGAAQEALDSALNVGPIVGLPITGTRIAQPYPVEQPEAAAQLDEIATSRTSEEITAPGFIERIYQEHGGRGAAYLLARVRKQLEVAWRQADAAFQNDPDNVTAQNELFAAQERLSALDDALARFRDQQGTQSEPETLTGHEAFEQFKKGVADLWHENVTKTLDSAFNEARRVVRQLGLGDTSVGAQQVPFMKRVLTDLDLATYKVVDPVVQEAGTQLRTLIERGQEAIDAATDPVIRQEITENLMEQAREQLTAIRQRLETMTQQAEQEVAGRDHTSDPFEVAAAQNETLLNDAEKADAFFRAAEQKAREGNDGLAEVRAGLLRKWARHRKEEGWVEQEIASRRRRLARPGNTRRFERTLQHEIRILQEDSFESAAERLMNHSRSLVQEVAGTPGPPAPPAPPTTPEADTSWLDRQRTRLFEGVPDPAGLGKELTPAQIDQAAQVLQDRADAVRRAIPEEKNKGRQDELMQLLTEALDRRQALLDSKPRQQEQKAPEKKPDPAAKLKSLREESRALSEAIDAVIGRIAKLIGADPRRVNSDLHSAELDDGLEGVLSYINRGKGRTPEAAALAAEWDAASDAHRAKYDEAREFYVANKEALAAHPDAIDNFISALEKLPRLADGTRLDITRKLVKAMYQNRNDPEWLASEISGRERRLAKYKKESGETALTKLIELELKLLREGDLQGMLDTLGKEFTSEYMHAWPVPNLAAMEKAAAPKQEQQQKAPEQKAPEKPKVEPTELPAAEAARKTLFGFVPRSVDGVMGMTLKRARANLEGFVQRYATFTGLLRELQARIAADPANPTLLALSKQYNRLQKDAIRIGKALRTKATPSRRDEAALADLEGITPEARIIEAAVRAARLVIDDKADELAARIEQIVKTIEDPRTPEAARRNLIAPLKKLYAEIADVRDANKSIPKVMRALKEAEIADDIKNLLGVETLREAAVEIVKVLENRHARYSVESFTQTDPDALVEFFNEVDAAQAWGDGEGSVGLVNETTDTFVTASAKRIRVRIIGKKTPQPVYKRMSVQAARELLEKNGSAEALAALEGLKNLDDSQKWMEPSDFLIIERHGFKGIEWKSNEMRQSQRVEITEFDKEGGTSTRFIGEVEPWVARQDGKPYENTLNALEKLEADELARAQVLGYTQPSVTFRLMKVEGGYVIVAEQIDGTPPIFSKEEQGHIPLTEYLGQVFDDAVRTGNKKREDNARVVSIDNDGDIGRTRVDVPTLMRMGLAEVAHQNLSNYADRQFETLSLAASVVFALLRGPNGRVIHGLTDSTIMYDRGEKFEGGKRYITWGDLKEKNPKRAQLLTDPGFLAAFQRSVIYRARRALGLEIEILPNKTKDGARDKDAALSPEQVAEYTSYWGVRAPSKLDGWSVFGLRSFIQKQLDRGGQVSGGRVKSIDILTKKDPNEVMTSKEIKAISAASKYRFPNHLRGLTVGMAREQLMALGKNPDKSFVGAAALQVLEGVHESKLVVPDQYQAMEKAGHKFAKNAHGITAQKLIDHLNEVIAKAESQLRAARRTSDYRNGLSFDKEGDGSHVVIHHGREGTTAFSDQDAGSSSIKLMTLPEAEALADQMRMTVGNSAFAVEPWTLDGGEFFADATPGMFSGFVITETVGGTEPAPAFDQARTRAEEEVFESSEQGNQDNRMLDTEENQLRTSTTWYKNQGASLGTSGPTTAEAAAQEAALLLQTRIASRPQRRAANVVFDDGTQAELARTIKETQEREKQLQLEIQSVERRLDELRKERVKESSKPPTKEQNAEFDSLQQQERDLHKQLIAAREAPARVGTQAKKLIEKVIDRVAKAMGLTYEFAITTDPNRIPQLAGRDLNSLPPAAVSFGWFKDGQGDGRVTIFLNPKKLDLSSRNPMQDAKLINALAHEMGHVVFWSYFDSLPVGLKARLYEAWAAENPGAATQFDGSDLSRRALLEDSARPFEEWMADQFIAYARDDAGMLGLSDAAREAGAQGWFTNLVDKLKQLWEMLTEHLGLNQEFKDFADGIRRSMDPINGPNNYTQAAWETSALPDDLPINVVRFMEEHHERVAPKATPGKINIRLTTTGWLRRSGTAKILDQIVKSVSKNLGLPYEFTITDDPRVFAQGNEFLLLDTEGVHGSIMYGNHIYIYLDRATVGKGKGDAATRAWMVKVLAHELGHLVLEHYKLHTDEDMQFALWGDFLKVLEARAKANPNSEVADLWAEASRIIAVLGQYGRKFNHEFPSLGEPQSQLLYAYEEWLAEQFSAYALADPSVVGAAHSATVRGWFERLVERIKQVWSEIETHILGGKNELAQSYKDFIDEIRYLIQEEGMPPLPPPRHFERGDISNMTAAAGQPQSPSQRLRDAVLAALNPTPGNHRSYTGFLQRVQNLGRAFKTGNSRIIRDTLATTGEVLLYSMNGRIRIMAESFPALKKLVTEFKPAAGTTGTSYRNRVHTEFSRFTVKLNSIIDWRDNLNMDRALENALIGDIPGRLNYLTDPASPLNAGERQHVQDIAAQVRAVMDEMHKYAVDAGVPMAYTTNYWPRVVDPVKLRDNANEVIQNLVTKLGWTTPHARDFVTKMLGQTPERRADTTQAAVDHAFDDEGQVVAAPWTESVNERSLTPGQFDQVFGDVRQTDVRLTLHNYITQLTKTAEFNRSFGQHKRPGDTTKWDRTARLRAILGEAMEQGMSEQEYREIQTMVDTLMGRVGITLPGWARHATSAAILYQNVRVLLFSVFSSFPDLATTVVRAGSYKTVHAAWKADLKNVVNKDSDLYAMARAWGVASDAITKSVVAEYSSSNFLSGWAKNISETYFKAIGLNAWTNFTRVAALAVGKQFLVEHMQGAATNPDSVARLTELGLTPADVQAWVDSGFSVYGMTETLENTPGAGRADRARMESLKKVRDALVRFTDEAVLRPDASQRPVWASDPRFVLLWHLKSFMYAFHETLNKRVWHEMTKAGPNGPINLMPLLHAALVFPLALLGLELREIIQYRLGGKEPRSRRLDPMARMIDLTARTGVLGPAQMGMDMRGASQRQSWAITGVAGPTASHLYELFAKPWTQTGPKSIPVASQIPWLRETVRPAFKSDSKPAAPKQRRQMSEGETKLVTGLSNSPALPAKAKAEIQSRIDAGKADTVLSYALYSKDVPAEARSMLRQVVHSGYAD